MATFSNNSTNALSGAIGNVVYTSWKGKPVVRTRPHYRNRKKKTFSDEQAATRLRFAVATKFLRSMRELLELGFKTHAVKMTGTNSAISYIMKQAITGAYPDFKIAYNKVLLCVGQLPNADTPAVTAREKGTIQFTWATNELTGKATPEDKVIMIAYSAEHNRVVYRIGPERSAGAGLAAIPGFSGLAVHTWISFISADENDVATSIYTGEVVVN